MSHPRRPSLAGLALAIFATAPAAALPEDVRVELSAAQATVGDRVEATLRLIWDEPAPPAGEPRFPTWQESWGEAEVLAVGEVESFRDQSDRLVYHQTLELAAFEVGEVRLPPVTVAVPAGEETIELATPEGVGFEIVSVLPEGEGGEGEAGGESTSALEPRPAAAPVALEGGSAFWWTSMALLALGLLTGRRLLERLESLPAEALGGPPPAPYQELLDRLGGLDPRGPTEVFHTGLSLALRGYLGRTLGFGALESTTSEIQRRLRAGFPGAGGTPGTSGAVTPELARRTVELLRACDRVRFSPRPAEGETREAPAGTERLERVRRIAGEIEERLRPAEAESATGAGAGREEAA